jgi:hypothetical protein
MCVCRNPWKVTWGNLAAATSRLNALLKCDGLRIVPSGQCGNRRSILPSPRARQISACSLRYAFSSSTSRASRASAAAALRLRLLSETLLATSSTSRSHSWSGRVQARHQSAPSSTGSIPSSLQLRCCWQPPGAQSALCSLKVRRERYALVLPWGCWLRQRQPSSISGSFLSYSFSSLNG